MLKIVKKTLNINTFKSKICSCLLLLLLFTQLHVMMSLVKLFSRYSCQYKRVIQSQNDGIKIKLDLWSSHGEVVGDVFVFVGAYL